MRSIKILLFCIAFMLLITGCAPRVTVKKSESRQKEAIESRPLNLSEEASKQMLHTWYRQSRVTKVLEGYGVDNPVFFNFIGPPVGFLVSKDDKRIRFSVPLEYSMDFKSIDLEWIKRVLERHAPALSWKSPELQLFYNTAWSNFINDQDNILMVSRVYKAAVGAIKQDKEDHFLFVESLLYLYCLKLEGYDVELSAESIAILENPFFDDSFEFFSLYLDLISYYQLISPVVRDGVSPLQRMVEKRREEYYWEVKGE